MHELMRHLRAHFDPLDDRMRCFAELGVQVEGWFKGELICLLTQLKCNEIIEGFDREVSINGRKKVDLTIQIDGRTHWIELKHWLIGRQKGEKYTASSYFCDHSSTGIIGDVDKLQRTPETDHRWMLLLMTARPDAADWNNGLRTFNTKFAPRRLVAKSDPTEFPAHYAMGLLRVDQDEH